MASIINSVVAQGDTDLAGVLVAACPASLFAVDDDSGVSPLHVAALLPGTEMMEVLLTHGADPNWGDEGFTPLHLTSTFGAADNARFLTVHGADPRFASADGTTPLHTAAKHGSVEVAAVLLEAGTPVDIPTSDEERLTPLNYGLAGDDPSKTEAMVRFLLENGADPLAKESVVSPLTVALCRRRELFSLLLDYCRDIDRIDGGGGTALYFAAYQGDTEAVREILSRKANPDAVCADGSTALGVALQRGHTAIAQLLRQHGATMPMKKSESPLRMLLHRCGLVRDP